MKREGDWNQSKDQKSKEQGLRLDYGVFFMKIEQK